MGRELEPYEIIERSIIKRFHRELWGPFIKAVKNYGLIKEGDRIAVCISGGKDSMLMAKLIQELHRHSDVPFEARYIVMNPGYNEENKKKIEDNARLLNIPIEMFETNIFAVADTQIKSPCYLCARMRRGHLYNRARQLGCNKIALGHHLDDVVETTLIGMFYSSQIKGMMPKLRSANFDGMELIRPMYCIMEKDIKAWCRYNNLEFIRCACHFVEEYSNLEDDGMVSKRQEVKNLLAQLEKTNPFVKMSIFNSIHGVSIDTLPGLKCNGIDYSFENMFDNGANIVVPGGKE